MDLQRGRFYTLEGEGDSALNVQPIAALSSRDLQEPLCQILRINPQEIIRQNLTELPVNLEKQKQKKKSLNTTCSYSAV